ncbi:hypothetical protein DWW23_25045 [Parabacteroides sp. AF14-59]|nr:hypothetical protein DWW23_25045 [Parabacteroides sp. AF14-59]
MVFLFLLLSLFPASNCHKLAVFPTVNLLLYALLFLKFRLSGEIYPLIFKKSRIFLLFGRIFSFG